MRAFAIAVLLGLGLIVVPAASASAATITEPSGKVEIGVAANGYAAPTTVTASGFQPFESVFLEVCNGRPPTANDWTPTIDCDLGSAPAAAVADDKGVVTFAADDPNHALYPFVGQGPQQLFSCLAPGATAEPAVGIESYSNCQLRVSTSNNDATDDQVFVTMTLPAGAKTGWGSPTFPKPAPAGGQSATGSQQSATSGDQAATSGSQASSAKDATTASGSTGSGSSSDDFPVLPVVLSIVIVAGGVATVLVLHKRRSGGVAA